jgi:hypothetical protein
VKDHVLLAKANHLPEASGDIRAAIDEAKIAEIISTIPEEWLMEEDMELTPGEKRSAYQEFLNAKLDKIDVLAKEALDAK